MISLLAKLGLDTSGFATGLAKAELAAKRAANNIGNSIKTQFAAAFGVAAIGAAVKSVVDYGGKISDLSKRTFLSKTALQEFDYIAQQTGTTLEGFVMAEQKLAQAQQKAIGGSKEMSEIFQRFGLSVKDLKQLDPHQLFLLLSSSIGKTQLSGRQVDEVLKLMGRSAGDLIPAMKEGFDGMIDRANRLGLILKDDVISKLDEAGDRLSEAKIRLRKPAADIAMYGVEKLEELMAAGSGANAVWGAMWDKNSAYNRGEKTLASIYGGAVDDYNNQIINSVGSQSLVQALQESNRKLDRIVENTGKSGEEIPNVL